jgi:hypothetical protein
VASGSSSLIQLFPDVVSMLGDAVAENADQLFAYWTIEHLEVNRGFRFDLPPSPITSPVPTEAPT